jgi:hypothetical protein
MRKGDQSGLSARERKRRLETKSIQLGVDQWLWLEARAERTYSRSAAAEIRRMVADAMEREARDKRETVSA